MPSRQSRAHQRVKAALRKLSRPCWLPEITETGRPGSKSHFGGKPLHRGDGPPPACGVCNAPLPLFVQIELDSLPAAALKTLPKSLRSGLLQFFFCTNKDCAAEDYGAFSRSMVATVLPRNTKLVEATGPGFPKREISGWNQIDDLPDWDDVEALAPSISLDDYDPYWSECDATDKAFPVRGDKLFGWPHWVQGAYYPTCSVCNQEMVYVLQMASNDHVPFMFGDCGVGHVCICPAHPERGSFYWSCC
jgi:uncharacterized protein YwqG